MIHIHIVEDLDEHGTIALCQTEALARKIRGFLRERRPELKTEVFEEVIFEDLDEFLDRFPFLKRT